MQFKSNAGADFSGRYTPKPHWLSGIRWPDDVIEKIMRDEVKPFEANRIRFNILRGEVDYTPGPPVVLINGIKPLEGENYIDYGKRVEKLLGAGIYPVKRNKRRYRKSWLKLLYGMFRPRARFTMLAPITCAFLAVAGVSFVAGMLTTILLSL